MEKLVIFDKLNVIFNDVLDPEEKITLSEDTCTDDIEEWDSLAQVQLVVEIEKQFGIKFTAKEILLWDNIGDMLNSISKHIR